MKLTKIFLFSAGFILLILISDLIYFYRNSPQVFGKIYLFLADVEQNKGNIDKSLGYLDQAARWHLKKNKKIYKYSEAEINIKNNPDRFDQSTKDEISKYLSTSLNKAFEKNTAPMISNLYYNLGLIVYKKNFKNEAKPLLYTAVLLDPELGHLYIELANLYINMGEIEKGREILKRCQKFKWPKKQCQEYLETSVKSGDYLQLGQYEDLIYHYQMKIN